MLGKIDRYIAGLFWAYFAAGLLIFCTIFLAVDAMSTLVSYPGVAGSAVIQYYIASLPEIAHRMLPVACLLGALFALSTLNRNNEMVALFSVGMSLSRITTPILLSVLLLSAVGYYVADQVIPSANRSKNFVFYHEIKRKPSLYSTVKNERIWYRSRDTIFNIKTLNEKTARAQGLTLYTFNEKWDLIQMITAREVELLGENWKLFDGSVTLFTEDSSFPITSDFKEKQIVMGEDAKDLSSTAHTSDVLSQKELKEFIRKNKEAGLDTVRYEVDYHSKFGFSFAALVMTIIGIPFGVSRTRSGSTMVNVGICLGLVFVYWIFYSSALTLGNYGHLPPLLAAWLPNVIMLGFGYYMIQRPQS
ncbi:MAG: LPS export ABC transporter permease LptG [Pseudobdellovibrionaceae bacterium]|jgi:lipopolysaccharide export system permease protein